MSDHYQFRPGPDGIGNLVVVPLQEEPDETLPVIYLYCTGQLGYAKTYSGAAIAEDGTLLWHRRSTAVAFLKVDLLHRARFEDHYPLGYRTEWVDTPETHTGLQQALRLYREDHTVVLRDTE